MSTLFDAMSVEVGHNKRFVELYWYELREGKAWERKSETDYDKALAVVRARSSPELVRIFEAMKP